MHRVIRGQEPDGLAAIRAKYTKRWVDHYKHKTGTKPTDAYWRGFHGDLEDVFHHLCGYCEELCKGEVDHFRPKSRYPERVYDWSNWVFACHDCNQLKGGKWPPGGYVDPCSTPRAASPASFFEFDTLTGEILPKRGLSAGRRKKAQGTIDDLQLNLYHHLKKRLILLLHIAKSVSTVPTDAAERKAFVEKVAGRETPLSSVIRCFLESRGFPVENS